jgi:hypothetical protein
MDTHRSDLLLEITAQMWHQVRNDSHTPLTSSPTLQPLIERWPDHSQRRQLQLLVERIQALAPEDRRQFVESLDEVQIRSKLWLIDELANHRDLDDRVVVFLGAWFGILPLLVDLTVDRPPRRMICIDNDARACALGEQVIGPVSPTIEYQVADVMDIDYAHLLPDRSGVVVNTICEHLHDVRSWWQSIPHGQFCVLQSNNYTPCPDHVNCVQDLREMKAQTPMAQLCFEGMLALPILDRFMLMGSR